MVKDAFLGSLFSAFENSLRSDEGEVNNKLLVSSTIFTLSSKRLCSPKAIPVELPFYIKSHTVLRAAQ